MSSTLTAAAPVSERQGEETSAAAPAFTLARDISTQIEPFGEPHRRRHRRLLSFLLVIVLPIVLMAVYLYAFADDQYVTEFRFSVRHHMPLKYETSAAALMGDMPTGAAAA